jgi:hypothetical protein
LSKWQGNSKWHAIFADDRRGFVPERESARDGNRTRTAVAGNRILSPARLPVPPPGLGNKKNPPWDGISPGAEDEARTRDLNLGKVALYQLSYFRTNKYLKN